MLPTPFKNKLCYFIIFSIKNNFAKKMVLMADTVKMHDTLLVRIAAMSLLEKCFWLKVEV